jgi:hypothetical protein
MGFFLFKDVYGLEYKAVSLFPTNEKATFGAEHAVDGDPYTYTQTDNGVGASWTIEFEEERSISCFTLIVRAGVCYL